MSHCHHCGVEIVKMRSEPDHRRFFALIHAAFEQWPEAHDFKPDNAEHLRKWLLCAAGHREVHEVPLPFAEDEPAVTRLATIAIEAAVRAAGGYAFVRTDLNGGRVAVYKARSINWETIGQKTFNEIRASVEEIIEREIGVTADELLRQKAMAA